MIAVPYTARHPYTLRSAPEDAEWHYVGADGDAYWRLLVELWARGEEIRLIEHDVICRPDVIRAFDACDRDWCAFPYHDHDEAAREAWRNMLGCTRFSARLVRALPNAVSSIPEERREWHYLCDGLGANLRAAGHSQHWHFPEVFHHHMNLRDLPL